MSRINFDVTPAEDALIQRIVERAAPLYEQDGAFRTALAMDIAATHRNGCPLRLEAWLAASDLDFGHDIAGILTCLDRRTGKLTRNFVPRFAAPED